MIRTVQWTLVAVWLGAIGVILQWFLSYGSYIRLVDLAFFIAGLGLGLVARRLLAGDEVIVMQTPAANGVREEVRS
jgi:hypothetical protein